MVSVQPREFTDGIDFTAALRLAVSPKREAKDGLEAILRGDEKTSPGALRQGLGRVDRLASDAKSRWAAPFQRWESFGTLWPQMVRDVSHRDRTIRAGVRPGNQEGEAVVYYDVLANADNPAAETLDSAGPPHILVETPGAAPRTLPLEQTAPGHYEARIPADQGGLYHIVSGSSELILPDAGFYRESEETKPQAVNTALLGEISRVTGGRMHPSPDQLLNDKGAMVRERQPLWPYWLILALLLNFVEVALRKGFFERLATWLRRHPLPRCWHASRPKCLQASQVAEKVVYFVIPSEARNLSLIETQEKRDSSARSAPRNDKNMSFSASCSACLLLRAWKALTRRAEACPTSESRSDVRYRIRRRNQSDSTRIIQTRRSESGSQRQTAIPERTKCCNEYANGSAMAAVISIMPATVPNPKISK